MIPALSIYCWRSNKREIEVDNTCLSGPQVWVMNLFSKIQKCYIIGYLISIDREKQVIIGWKKCISHIPTCNITDLINYPDWIFSLRAIRYQDAIDKYESVMKTEPNVPYYTNLAKERICFCLVKVRERENENLCTSLATCNSIKGLLVNMKL